MSTRSGRASRAAAPTSFAPPKVNRGWGTSRAYAPGKGGRSTPVRGARKNRGAKGKVKSEAAKRIEARGGVVRKFKRVLRSPVDTLTLDTAAGIKVWKWVPESEITDPKERKELGLEPLPEAEEDTANVEAEQRKKEEQAIIDAENEAAFHAMTGNKENPYSFPESYDDKVKASSASSAGARSAAASSTTPSSAAAAYLATAATEAASAGEKRKVRDPTYDPNRLATGTKRRPIAKDKRFQGLPGESPCGGVTTRGKPCLNTCAPNSKFCHLHNTPKRWYDSDDDGGEDGGTGGGAAAAGVGAGSGAGATAASYPSGYSFAPSAQAINRGGGGKWKSDDITEKCQRYAGQPGQTLCEALTTRGKQCGFSASVDKGGSIYCPVHRSNFERNKEKFERQQERARAELEAEKAAANNPAFAPSGSAQAMAAVANGGSSASGAGVGGDVGGESAVAAPAAPAGPLASPILMAQHQAQQQARAAMGGATTSTTAAAAPAPTAAGTSMLQQQQQQQQQQYYQQQYGTTGGAPFQMDPRHGSNAALMQQFQQNAARQQQPQQQHQQQQYQQQQQQQQHQQQYPWPGSYGT